MKRPQVKEMRAFLIASSLLVAALIVVIVVLTTWNAVKTIDQEQEKARQKEVENLVKQSAEATESLEDVANDPRMIQFMNPELLQMRSGQFDITPYLDSTIFIMRAVGSAEYSAIVSGGEVVVHAERGGVDYDDIEVPLTAPEKGYAILDQLGGRQGYFVEFFQPGSFPTLDSDQFSVSVVDRTAEMKALDEYYDNERSSLIWKQVWIGLVGLLVALVVCLVGLRMLTRYYITRPIEDLQKVSRQLMDGSFEGEVLVDEKSDFADMQRLLQAGKLVLDKMEEVTK
jgi:hypothetical protein